MLCCVSLTRNSVSDADASVGLGCGVAKLNDTTRSKLFSAGLYFTQCHPKINYDKIKRKAIPKNASDVVCHPTYYLLYYKI